MKQKRVRDQPPPKGVGEKGASKAESGQEEKAPVAEKMKEAELPRHPFHTNFAKTLLS